MRLNSFSPAGTSPAAQAPVLSSQASVSATVFFILWIPSVIADQQCGRLLEHATRPQPSLG
ncbi:hypothetical protein EMIT0P176_150105 [Pseudomonas sp. IT-P176]